MNYYHYTISVFLSHLFLLWLNLTFTAILFFSAVSAPGCMKLNLSRPVKTSPGDCMTSHMKANTNCSFSCLQGYQLQGPPFTLCGSNGEWTNSAKAVSCKGELWHFSLLSWDALRLLRDKMCRIPCHVLIHEIKTINS